MLFIIVVSDGHVDKVVDFFFSSSGSALMSSFQKKIPIVDHSIYWIVDKKDRLVKTNSIPVSPALLR